MYREVDKIAQAERKLQGLCPECGSLRTGDHDPQCLIGLRELRGEMEAILSRMKDER